MHDFINSIEAILVTVMNHETVQFLCFVFFALYLNHVWWEWGVLISWRDSSCLYPQWCQLKVYGSFFSPLHVCHLWHSQINTSVNLMCWLCLILWVLQILIKLTSPGESRNTNSTLGSLSRKASTPEQNSNCLDIKISSLAPLISISRTFPLARTTVFHTTARHSRQITLNSHSIDNTMKQMMATQIATWNDNRTDPLS